MVTVRRAGIEDMEDVVRLRWDFFQEVHPETPALNGNLLKATRRYVAEKLPSDEFRVWFAEDDGQIIGTGAVLFWQRPPTPGCAADLHAYVLNMYTVPERRGQGVATLLLEHIIDHVKATPARRVTLHATDLGRSVYEKLGFTACNDEMKLTI